MPSGQPHSPASSTSSLNYTKKDEESAPDDVDRTPSYANQDDVERQTPPATSPPQGAEKNTDPFEVGWENENDPANPRNFPVARKAAITALLGMLALTGSFASSIISPAESAIAEQMGISEEVAILCVSLYVLGFAFGPCIWAPISEVYGRKWSLLPAVFMLSVFSIATAESNTPAAVFITRFFGGIFGAAPVSNVSAALGDLYSPSARGIAVSFYALAVTGGPTISPIIGAALNLKLGWRWTEYITAIFAFAVFVIAVPLLPETFAPVLLKQKARRLRKESSDDRYHHPHENERITLQNVVTKYLSRPLRMLITEPMVAAIAIYASFVYGLLYMTLEVFPIVFADIRGFGPVVSTLPFLGLFVGVCVSLLINLGNVPRYARAVAKNNGNAVPEARLPPMLVGGVLFVIGLFFFGWTASPNIHWAAPVVATGFIGSGFNIIFQQCINTLVDLYALYAASAVSANTILRSLVACGLPLAVRPMFFNLGVGPACSLLGGVAALALPIPLVIMRYGPSLRRKSKFAAENP